MQLLTMNLIIALGIAGSCFEEKEPEEGARFLDPTDVPSITTPTPTPTQVPAQTRWYGEALSDSEKNTIRRIQTPHESIPCFSGHRSWDSAFGMDLSGYVPPGEEREAVIYRRIYERIGNWNGHRQTRVDNYPFDDDGIDQCGVSIRAAQASLHYLIKNLNLIGDDGNFQYNDSEYLRAPQKRRQFMKLLRWNLMTNKFTSPKLMGESLLEMYVNALFDELPDIDDQLELWKDNEVKKRFAQLGTKTAVNGYTKDHDVKQDLEECIQSNRFPDLTSDQTYKILFEMDLSGNGTPKEQCEERLNELREIDTTRPREVFQEFERTFSDWRDQLQQTSLWRNASTAKKRSLAMHMLIGEFKPISSNFLHSFLAAKCHDRHYLRGGCTENCSALKTYVKDSMPLRIEDSEHQIDPPTRLGELLFGSRYEDDNIMRANNIMCNNGHGVGDGRDQRPLLYHACFNYVDLDGRSGRSRAFIDRIKNTVENLPDSVYLQA